MPPTVKLAQFIMIILYKLFTTSKLPTDDKYINKVPLFIICLSDKGTVLLLSRDAGRWGYMGPLIN